MSALFSLSFVSSCYLCLLFVLSLIHLCLSNQNFDDTLCIESERQALLQFKHGLVDEANRLASWGGEEIDCCKWAGIGCDNSTGHVNRIHLRALDGHCDFYELDSLDEDSKEYEEAIEQRLGGNLSSSLLHLKQLRHLDLSCNDFLNIQVPNFIGSLENLEYLNLSYSNFGGIIPPQFGHLSQLHVLSLHGYSYGFRSTNIHWLSSLRMLHHLDMSGVDLSKATNWLQVINTLPYLAQLHMSNCELLHVHPQVSSLNLTSLSFVDLSYNNFNTSMPPWMFSITSLVSLDLSGCNFHGPIPSSIYSFRNLTSLQLLHVSGNDFMNSSLVLKGLSSVGGHLIVLDMKSCGVSSSVLESLHNLTSLRSLDLSGNQLTETIPKSLVNFCNLRDMVLADNDLGNTDFTNLLESFVQCKSPALESIRLSYSGLSGRLPDQFGQLMHLEHLRLDGNHIAGTIPDSIGQLSSMKTLDLRGNLISGPIPFSIGRLSLLENLYLSSNQLNGSIPDSIGRLSSLIELDLSNNQLDGLPNSLGQLSKLKDLKILNNLLTGVVTEAHFAKLSSLRSLNYDRFSWEVLKDGNNLTLRLQNANWIPPFQVTRLNLRDWCLGPQFPLWLRSQKHLLFLDISNTGISHMPPESFWRSLTSLYYLDMSQNHIQGPLLSIPANLSILDLSSNKFRGKLPDLSNTSLPTFELDLSNNSFTGSLHHVLCPYDVQLTLYLNLGYNRLSGVIPECWEKFPDLEFLNLENNNLSCGIPRTLGSSYRLEWLNLHGNKLSGRLPASLMNLTGLQILQLGGNELAGSIPAWFGRKLCLLRLLNLRSNHFDGNIPQEFCYLKQIQILDLANNKFRGKLPDLSNSSLPTYQLDLSNNSFTGSLHHVLCPYDVQSTVYLNLGYNSLSGVIPECWEKFPYLKFLNLENNNLSGGIPRTLGYSYRLRSLNLHGNKLSGRLPASLMRLTGLEILQLGGNELVGSIPEWFGRTLSVLRLLNLRSNHFDGNIPRELCYLKQIQILDLANNNLSGNIPRCFNNFSILSGEENTSGDPFWETTYVLHVSAGLTIAVVISDSLVVKGQIHTYDSILGLVMLMDLSNNSFSGNIPVELTTLQMLQSLNLSRNQLTGSIPEKIGGMKALESFDVSLNKLSGKLPVNLSSLHFLSCFNVSYNNLTGRIPTSTQLQSFNESCFLGNILCGDPLAKRCAVEVPATVDQNEDDGSHRADWGLVISIVLGFLAGFWFVVAPLMISKSWRIAYYRFLDKLWYMVSDVMLYIQSRV